MLCVGMKGLRKEGRSWFLCGEDEHLRHFCPLIKRAREPFILNLKNFPSFSFPGKKENFPMNGKSVVNGTE